MSESSGSCSDDTRYRVAFNHAPGIGPARFADLVARFGSAETAWRAPAGALAGVLDARAVASVVDTRARLDLDRALAKIAAAGARPLADTAADFPPLLRETGQAPYVLYVQGDARLLASRAVAVVGTRRATAYGLRVAGTIAGQLAAAGVTVVSGLALGIDAAAHRAALDAGGGTIAVLGCGPDVEYPPANRALQADIGRRGAVVTEYPPGTPPEAGNFPARNRIVSGLSLACVVVEAGEQSGALITARMALDQGRDVFAVPGSIYSRASVGTNSLLVDGAAPARSADDVLAALALGGPARPGETRQLPLGQVATPVARREWVPATETEAALLAELGGEGVHIDDLVRRTGRPTSDVARTLAVMEIKGMVTDLGGMCWAVVP